MNKNYISSKFVICFITFIQIIIFTTIINVEMGITQGKVEKIFSNMPPPLKEFIHMSFEKREEFVKEKSISDSSFYELLGMIAFWYKQEGNLEKVREYEKLIQISIETFCKQNNQNQIPGKCERMSAEIYLRLGDRYAEEGNSIYSLDNYIIALNYLIDSKNKRLNEGLEPFDTKDNLFGGGGDGLEASYYLRITSIYREIGDFIKADEYEKMAYEVIKNSENLWNYSDARIYEANDAYKNGDIKKALNICNKGIEKVFSAEHPVGFATFTNNMINLYRRASFFAHQLNDFKIGISYINKAIFWDRKKNDKNNLVSDLIFKSFLLNNSGNNDEAEETLFQLKKLLLESDFELSISDKYQYHMVAGEINRIKYIINNEEEIYRKAIDDFSKAISVVEELRYNIHNINQKHNFFAVYSTPYDRMVSLLYDRYIKTNNTRYLTQSLEIAEKKSTRIFTEDTYRRRIEITNVLPGASAHWLSMSRYLKKLENDYKKILSILRSEKLDTKDRDYLLKKLEEIIDQKNGAILNLIEHYPKEMQYLNPTTPNIEDVISNIQDKVSIIRYFVGDKEIFLWGITKNKKVFKKITIDSKMLLNKVKHFRKLISNPFNQSLKEIQTEGLQLYQYLLEPVKDIVNSNTEYLLIIPDNYLLELPFESLTYKKNGINKFFIQKVPIIYSPSIVIYHILNSTFIKDRIAPPLFLGVGDPFYGKAKDIKDENNTINKILIRSGLKLSNLPNTRNEIVTVSKIFGEKYSKLLLGKDAILNNFEKQILSDYAFIHIAVHGFLPNRMMGLVEPTLAFSNISNNNLLSYSKTLNYDFRSYLVTLSACNSGIGEILTGEGILSFARSMLLRGNDHALASLWSVEDKSTSMLMTKFYSEIINNNEPIAKALQIAKIWLMNESIKIESKRGLEGSYKSKIIKNTGDKNNEPIISGRSPYFWSGFILFGTNAKAQFIEPTGSEILGTEKAPVKCNAPRGEREYLNRLICPGGTPVEYSRTGNIGKGVYGNTVDIYEIKCSNGAYNKTIYMDMYFPGYRERRPISGFSITD